MFGHEQAIELDPSESGMLLFSGILKNAGLKGFFFVVVVRKFEF